MKKIVFILFTCLCLSIAVKADDLQLMSESQAKAAVNLLQKQKYVLLYCSCCAEGYDSKTYVRIESVTYRHAGYEDFYEVIVEGYDANGKNISESIDLAYTYIKKNKKGKCVGLELHFFCMPCEKSVKWNCPIF